MIFLSLIILIVPALIAVLLYERFRGTELIMRKRVELTLIFAFLINLLTYTIMWLRGTAYFNWDFSVPDAEITRVSFMVQYMFITIVLSVVLAYVMSLVRVGKREKEETEEEGEEISQIEQPAETEK